MFQIHVLNIVKNYRTDDLPEFSPNLKYNISQCNTIVIDFPLHVIRHKHDKKCTSELANCFQGTVV